MEKLKTFIGFTLIYIMLGIFKEQAFKEVNYMKFIFPVHPSTLFKRYINNFCFFETSSNFIGFEICISLLKDSHSKYFTMFLKEFLGSYLFTRSNTVKIIILFTTSSLFNFFFRPATSNKHLMECSHSFPAQACTATGR